MAFLVFQSNNENTFSMLRDPRFFGGIKDFLFDVASSPFELSFYLSVTLTSVVVQRFPAKPLEAYVLKSFHSFMNHFCSWVFEPFQLSSNAERLAREPCTENVMLWNVLELTSWMLAKVRALGWFKS